MPYPNYYGYQQPINPAIASQQARLGQLEQQYAQMQPQMMTQPQMVQQPSMLNGRIIDDIGTVAANEVSMDGSLAIFPMRDLSAIYVRQWQNDGSLRTAKYTLEVEPNNSAQQRQEKVLGLSDEFTEGIMKRFDELEQKIDSIGKKTTPTRAKKESEET